MIARNSRPLPSIPTIQQSNHRPKSLPHLSYPRAKTCSVAIYQPSECIQLSDSIQNELNSVINENISESTLIHTESNILDLVAQHTAQQTKIQQQREQKQIERQHAIEQQLSTQRKHSSSFSSSVKSPTDTTKPVVNKPIDLNLNEIPDKQHTTDINNFSELTGVTDHSKIEKLLSLLDWNLDRSVALYFSDTEVNIDDTIEKAEALKNR